MEKKTTTSKKPATKSKAPSNQESRLQEFFMDELKDIYWAEKHLVKTLPKMKKATTTEELQNAITDHLEQTKEHVTRLEQVFEALDHKPQAKKCEAMEGITKEGASIIEDTEDGTITRDVGIIMAAQKVEHYEIATYGSLAQLATTLGYEEVAGILKTTLEEEKKADQLLTTIAEQHVNQEAFAEQD